MPDKSGPRPSHYRSRWRWYYFYFVFALIDVLVIIAALYANHRTITSFDAALADVGACQQREIWLNDLRFAIIQLDAPGNDIFESRDLPHERARLAAAREHFEQLVSHRPKDADAISATTAHVAEMTRQAEGIFKRFEGILDDAASESTKSSLLAEATAAMAEMDRAQANALIKLVSNSRSSLDQERTVLDRHQISLAQRTGIERIFMGVLAAILVCVFLYGRQLHRTHEQLEREQRLAESERQSRLASIGEVCFACAHGIRNPLTSIITCAELILNHGRLDDESRSRLRNLIDSAWFLNDCVTRLLTFAHAPKLTIADVAPEDVLERALATLSDRIRERGLHVTRSYGSGELGIRADETLLTQAAIELISNAIDHTPEGGHISLVTTRHPTNGGWVELGVVDDGPGIPVEVRARACELFFTLRTGGTGIGLATVKRAADLHEGVVLLSEAAPNGADVRIRLPVVSTA